MIIAIDTYVFCLFIVSTVNISIGFSRNMKRQLFHERDAESMKEQIELKTLQSSTLTHTDIENCKVSDISAMLKSRGVRPTRKKKMDLIEQLQSVLRAEQYQEADGGVVSLEKSPGSKQRKSQRAGRVNKLEMPLGPNGLYLCRWCQEESSATAKSKKGKTFCSPGCLHEHKIRTNANYVRKCLLVRDKGICQKCGFEVHKLFLQAYNAIRNHKPSERLESQLFRAQREDILQQILKDTPFQSIKVKLSRRFGLKSGQFWDADHIVPVVKGGGLQGLSNFRLLCKPCHFEVTRSLKDSLVSAKKVRKKHKCEK